MASDINDQFIGFRLPKKLVAKLDDELKNSLDFANRSHLIRTLLEDFLNADIEIVPDLFDQLNEKLS